MAEYYWLKVTTDRLSLPLVVASSSEELAQILGIKRRTILETISRNKTMNKICPYEKVLRIGDEEI